MVKHFNCDLHMTKKQKVVIKSTPQTLKWLKLTKQSEPMHTNNILVLLR